MVDEQFDWSSSDADGWLVVPEQLAVAVQAADGVVVIRQQQPGGDAVVRVAYRNIGDIIAALTAIQRDLRIG